MPIFEFHCQRCSQKFEKLLKQSAKTFPCPLCGLPAQRAVSAPVAVGDAVCSSPPGSGFR
jgi:putative FmdB family regulatory protein